MNIKRTIHTGNSGTEGVGVAFCVWLGVGWAVTMGLEVLYGFMSGYLSTALEAKLFTYAVLPIPELPISVALGYLLA